jgi:hypothetical protein
MKPQDLPAVKIDTASAFDLAVDNAAIELHAYQNTYGHALSIGIRPIELVRYVMGDLRDRERDEITSSLGSSQWAMKRVVALVKARRAEPPLLFHNVTSAILGNEEDQDIEGAKLLDTL